MSRLQAAWFRLRRCGLVEPFDSPESAAGALLGIQAQLLPAAHIALWNRSREATSAGIDELLYKKRSLIRLWGQRDTVHLYPSADWPLVSAAFSERQRLVEDRLKKRQQDVEAFYRQVRKIGRRMGRGEALSHGDLRRDLDLEEDAYSYAYFKSLVWAGLVCHGIHAGGESRFVHRKHWLPDLAWNPPSPEEANAVVARRYLAAYGPATPQDLTFWHGTSAKNARRWMAAIEKELCGVDLEGERRWALSRDLDELTASPPPLADWPTRLLYRFDPMLLALKDKTWLVEKPHYKRVWKPAGHVEAVLLRRGRIEATWRYQRSPTALKVSLFPFGRLAKTARRQAEKEASGIARFFGLTLRQLTVEEAGP